MQRADDHLDVVFPTSFINFARHCEVHCVAGCCGLDAFSFDDSTLESAIQAFGITQAGSMYDETREAAERFARESRQCWSSQDDFNAIWENGAELSKWIQGILDDTERLTQRLIKPSDADNQRSAGA